MAIARAILPWAALCVTFTIFSLYTVLMKKAIADGSNPIVLAFLRELIASSVLLPIAYLSQRRKPDIATRRFLPRSEHLGHFILLGALMIWGVQLLSALALQHLSANTYAIFAPSVPVFCLVVALVFGYERFNRRERASWLKLAAVLLTAGGALFIALHAYAGSTGSQKNALIGIGMLLSNKVSVASYPVLEKRLLKEYDALVVVAWGYAFGALQVLMSVIPCVTETSAWSISSSGIGAIAYSSLLSSAFNYAVMIQVNKAVGPVAVMAAYPLQSVMTPLLSYAILGAGFEWSDAIGGAIIVGGLLLLIFARREERQTVGSGMTDSADPMQHAKLEETLEVGEPEPSGSGGVQDPPSLGAASYHEDDSEARTHDVGNQLA
jgi:drug/metabolite transporter (DMT)-like permease